MFAQYSLPPPNYLFFGGCFSFKHQRLVNTFFRYPKALILSPRDSYASIRTRLTKCLRGRRLWRSYDG